MTGRIGSSLYDVRKGEADMMGELILGDHIKLRSGGIRNNQAIQRTSSKYCPLRGRERAIQVYKTDTTTTREDEDGEGERGGD